MIDKLDIIIKRQRIQYLGILGFISLCTTLIFCLFMVLTTGIYRFMSFLFAFCTTMWALYGIVVAYREQNKLNRLIKNNKEVLVYGGRKE